MSSGLLVTEFSTEYGRVHVYLPQDLAMGDTISGTVVADPRGEGEERQKNDAVLSGVVIEVAGKTAQKSEAKSSCWIRVSQLAASGLHEIKLSVPGATWPALVAPVTVDEPNGSGGTQFGLPTLTPMGRPFEIAGPFDGDMGNTKVTVGGRAMPVVAESPRGCVTQTDSSFIGKKSISVTEGGKTASGEVFVPRLALSATKTNLLRGETAVMTVTVDGLSGAPESLFPIPVEIVNLSPSVIDLPKYVNFGIERAEVSNGVFTRRYTVRSLQSGAFVVSGLLYNVSLHQAKNQMTYREWNDWVRALIVVYAKRIEDLKAEIAKLGRNADEGLKNNLARKENLIKVLRAYNNVSLAVELRSAITSVDQQLAVDNAFSVASDLVSLAADFLGYTSVPLPNLGTLLKGLAVLAKGSANASQAVKAARAIYDGIKTAQDAKDKADSLKEALDKVREAMK